MAFSWPWSKHFSVKCPDGTPRFIHRNVDDAFPLFLKERSSNTKAAMEALQTAKADVSVDQKTTIGYILFKLDDKNSSMQASFRAAYIVYSSSPCTKSDYLQEAVERIRAEEQNLRAVEMAITNLLNALSKIGSTEQAANQQEIINRQLSIAIHILGYNQEMATITQKMSAVSLQTQEWSQQ